MEKFWKIKKTVVKTGDKLFGYNPIILKLLALRGLSKEKEINNFFDFNYETDLSDPMAILGMEKIAERLKQAKAEKEKIAIYGDYDADGVTASAILYEALKDLGFLDVICYIPDRQMEGYGLNDGAIDQLSAGGVKLIITVDCGITNHQEIKRCRELGIDVIVTDHHQLPLGAPKEAFCVINPNICDSGFCGNYFSGAGVAFKLAQALYQKISPGKINHLKWMLDLVAIGTIADCVPLVGENRTLVKYGLIVISKTRRTGLIEMFKIGRMDISENNIPDVHKTAFQIAPRINAAGRMNHASASYNLLIEKKPVLAREMALELESQNQERQKITSEIAREARILAENSFKNKKLIFASNSHWPIGILGLVAGKIAEEFQKPAGIFRKEINSYTGSFRSIPQINIIEIIAKCSEMLVKFGGHSQAAGATVSSENFEKFYEKISNLVEKEFKGKEIMPLLEIDCEISFEDIDWELTMQLKKMEPFGMGNAEPIFLIKNIMISDLKIVGNGSKHLKLGLRGESGSPKIFDAIGFSLADRFPDLKINDKIDIVINIREDEWNGNHKIQLMLIDLRCSH